MTLAKLRVILAVSGVKAFILRKVAVPAREQGALTSV